MLVVVVFFPFFSLCVFCFFFPCVVSGFGHVRDSVRGISPTVVLHMVSRMNQNPLLKQLIQDTWKQINQTKNEQLIQKQIEETQHITENTEQETTVKEEQHQRAELLEIAPSIAVPASPHWLALNAVFSGDSIYTQTFDTSPLTAYEDQKGINFASCEILFPSTVCCSPGSTCSCQSSPNGSVSVGGSGSGSVVPASSSVSSHVSPSVCSTPNVKSLAVQIRVNREFER